METLNTDRPGLPNYTGPTKGYFTCVHHEVLFEYSHDINERLAYVDREKPKHEVATRRYNMLYLPFVDAAWFADYEAKRAPLVADYRAKRAALVAPILAYLLEKIPDHNWNGRTLVFPEN